MYYVFILSQFDLINLFHSFLWKVWRWVPRCMENRKKNLFTLLDCSFSRFQHSPLTFLCKNWPKGYYLSYSITSYACWWQWPKKSFAKVNNILGIPMKYIESVLKNKMKLKSVTSDYIHEKEAKNYCKILGM